MTELTAISKVEVKVSSKKYSGGAQGFSEAMMDLTSRLVHYEKTMANRSLENFTVTCSDSGSMVPEYTYTITATYTKKEAF